MLLELAKPITLLACILSLLGLFHAAFLEPATTPLQHLEDALGPLLMAAALALLGGIVFLSAEGGHAGRRDAAALLHTFPIRVFGWATTGMAVFFLVAWYLETHVILYRDVRF